MEVQKERLDRQARILFPYLELRFYFLYLLGLDLLYLFLFFTRIIFTIATRNRFTLIYFVIFSFLGIGLLLLLGLLSLQIFLFYK
jgi:hypothetical protein